MEVEQRRTSRLLAFLGSLLCPGLGQLYNGEIAKALAFFLGLLLCTILTFVSGPWWLTLGVFGIYLALGLSLFLKVAVIAEAVWSAGKERPLRRYNRWWVYLLVLILAQCLTEAVHYVGSEIPLAVRSYSIPSGSMIPALSPGDYVMADMTAYRSSKPERFDIAVFRSPLDSEYELVKRVVGLPGETIAIKDGRVFIDGKAIEGPWEQPEGDFPERVIPADTYFVLGDNINDSRDSRFIGEIPRSDLRGRMVARFWPPSRAATLRYEAATP